MTNVSVKVLAYIIAEVHRQGHEFWRLKKVDSSSLWIDIPVEDGAQRTLWMLRAWRYAQDKSCSSWIDSHDVEMIGRLVEEDANREGFRKCGVRVGNRICVDYKKVPKLLDRLLTNQRVVTPEEFYKTFLEVHPFVDGNGRSAKILYNILKGTLDDPGMPPNFFGCSNP